MATNIALRPAVSADYLFARQTYYDTMRWLIEELFGWDQEREDTKFANQFKLEEVRIITNDGRDVGWLQAQLSDEAFNIGQIYVIPAMQNKGIGSRVLHDLIAEARALRRVTRLSVVKINPALRLYTATGFRVVGEDQHKYYMQLD